MKTKLGAIPLVYPIPIVLCGANVKGKPNYATLGDCGIMNVKPPHVYVALAQTHYTTGGIIENQTFSVNFPSTRLMVVTDYCGMVSGKNTDKSKLFENFYGELGTAPMILDCPANLECRVVKDFLIHNMRVFVGEVVQAYADEECVVERKGRKAIADMTKLDPLIYAMDNRYYKIGEAIGTGFSEGRDFH